MNFAPFGVDLGCRVHMGASALATLETWLRGSSGLARWRRSVCRGGRGGEAMARESEGGQGREQQLMFSR